jgi:transcriptional regulator NrdR family protein
VSDAQIDAIADAVQRAVMQAGGELATSAIGDLCLNGLGGVDRGAYLQFAGTLPSQDVSLFASDSEVAGSLPTGSVRAKSNSPESPA